MESYLQEVQNFKQKWPDIEFIDLIFTDINATPRGKRIPIDALEKLDKGVALPSRPSPSILKVTSLKLRGWAKISENQITSVTQSVEL